jgi:hypothetical protein
VDSYGTHHFVSLKEAVRYYDPYGIDRAEVLRKIAAGEIAIGEPPAREGYRVTLLANEGRYAMVATVAQS